MLFFYHYFEQMLLSVFLCFFFTEFSFPFTVALKIFVFNYSNLALCSVTVCMSLFQSNTLNHFHFLFLSFFLLFLFSCFWFFRVCFFAVSLCRCRCRWPCLCPLSNLREGLGVDPTEIVSTSGPESDKSSSSFIKSSISSGSTSPTFSAVLFIILGEIIY